jgi:hypothetical protein
MGEQHACGGRRSGGMGGDPPSLFVFLVFGGKSKTNWESNSACTGAGERGEWEGALKPQNDRVHWIMVKPTGKFHEPLILMVLISLLGAQTRVHKGKLISVGGKNLGGHRIVCIILLLIR